MGMNVCWKRYSDGGTESLIQVWQSSPQLWSTVDGRVIETREIQTARGTTLKNGKCILAYRKEQQQI